MAASEQFLVINECGSLQWCRSKPTESAPSQRENGGVIIELAITLPLFLLGLLVLVWLGITWNAKTTLTTSLTHSLRMAVTRGQSTIVGKDLIPAVQSWNVNALTPLLASPDQSGNWNINYGAATSPVFGVGLSQLPETYTYALIYFNQAMKQSVGKTVRYPCNPTLPENDGCVQCVFLNPDTLRPTDPFVDPVPPGRLGMECRYRPSSLVLAPIVRLIHLVAGHGGVDYFVIKRRKFVDAPV